MIELMLAILAAWFVSLFAGPAIYAAMGLAGFAFLAFAGIPGIVIPQKVAMAANSFPLLAAPLPAAMARVRGCGVRMRPLLCENGRQAGLSEVWTHAYDQDIWATKARCCKCGARESDRSSGSSATAM